MVQAVQREAPRPGRVGEGPRVPGLGRRPAPAVRPAPGGPGPRLRRVPLGRHLDGGVRLAGLALRPDALRRAHPGPLPGGPPADRHVPGPAVGRSVLHQRRAPLLPHRQGRPRAADLAGRLPAGRGRGRHRVPGRSVRGPYLRLAGARVRGGGSVLSADGSKATIDSSQNVAATKLMADAVKGGAAPKAVSTYMEPESLSAWQTGRCPRMPAPGGRASSAAATASSRRTRRTRAARSPSSTSSPRRTGRRR